MRKSASSMEKVYDVFAEQTKKHARIYTPENSRKNSSAKPSKLAEPAEQRRKIL